MRIRTRRAGPMAVALVLIALVGLACGRGGGGATTAPTTPAPTVAPPGSPPAPRAAAGRRAELRADAMGALKARGDFEIDRRLRTLAYLSRRVHDATHLTADDSDALTTQLAAETSGLTALKAKIDADTDLATLRADLRDIVTQYRVYLLMDPKVHLVIGADR